MKRRSDKTVIWFCWSISKWPLIDLKQFRGCECVSVGSMRWAKMCDILKSVQCLNLDAEPHFRTLHWVRCQCVCRHHLASVLLPHVKTWIFRFIYSWSILRWSFGAMRCVASNRQCTLYIAHHLHQHKSYVTSKILFIYFRRTVLLQHFVLPGKFEIFCSSQVCLMIFRPEQLAFRMIEMMWEITISIHSFLFIWKMHANIWISASSEFDTILGNIILSCYNFENQAGRGVYWSNIGYVCCNCTAVKWLRITPSLKIEWLHRTFTKDPTIMEIIDMNTENLIVDLFHINFIKLKTIECTTILGCIQMHSSPPLICNSPTDVPMKYLESVSSKHRK